MIGGLSYPSRIFMKKQLLFALIFMVILGLGFAVKSNRASGAFAARVVTVYIDGEQRTIASNATTVKDVIKRLDKTLSEHDKTEPGLNEQIRGNEYTINVYRARPITVVDGANNYTVLTAERSPRQIAQDAGFATKPEDQFGFRRSDDPFEGAPGTQMVIKRAKTISFDLYGTADRLSTNEYTVSDLLQARGVKLEPADELNVPVETRITEGMTVSIARIGKALETVEEPVAFAEEEIKDAQQPQGYKKIQTAGANGKKLVTYELVTRNGGEPTRTAIKEIITQ